MPKLSIIVITYNDYKNLNKTLKSIQIQTDLNNVQVIVVDGLSNDETQNVIAYYNNLIDSFISEPDDGIYDAMNKGLTIANGDWVLYLNSGDSFYNDNVLRDVKKLLVNKGTLYFGKAKNYWKSQSYIRSIKYHNDKIIRLPSHQATFIPKCFYTVNKFNSDLKISADSYFLYDCFHSCMYEEINLIISNFELGGVSNYYPSFRLFKIHLSENYNKSYLAAFKLIVKFILQKTLGKNMYLSVISKCKKS